MNSLQNTRNFLCRILSIVCFGWLFAIAAYIVMGKPDPFMDPHGFSFGWKSARKPFEFLLITYGAFLLIHPRRKEQLEKAWNVLVKWGENRLSIWILFGAYFALFLLHSLSEFFAIDVNFLPFSFYDHMLHYLFQGKIHYTGLALHKFYHTTTIIYSLVPIWYFLKTPLVLVFAHAFLLSAACLPLYFLARHILKDAVFPLVIAFTYLNYRFLLNVLAMDFTELSFYPLIIFSLIHFLVKGNMKAYFPVLFLGLLVKEDGPFYFGCLGLFLLVFKRGMRRIGLVTAFLSLAYGIFIFKVLIPVTGSTIAQGSARNYPQYMGESETPGEVITHLITHPHDILKELFVVRKPPADLPENIHVEPIPPFEKLRTYFKLLSRLLFIPLITLWFLPVLAALFPCFLQGGFDGNFLELKFHYSAPTIGFLFVALIFGLSNLLQRFKDSPNRRWFALAMALGLIALNGANYYRMRFTLEHLKSIKLASSLDPKKSVAIHGHLFPYIGYRENALFYSHPLDRPAHKYRDRYVNSDYFLIDLGVNPYPFSKERVLEKLEELKARPDLSLSYEDGQRFLFVRQASHS